MSNSTFIKKLFFSLLRCSGSLIILLVFQAEAGAISLSEALTEALNNNPGIQAARSKYESAKARIPQASSLDEPWFIYKPDAEMDIMDASFGISQEIPFPTKLIYRGKLADM